MAGADPVACVLPYPQVHPLCEVQYEQRSFYLDALLCVKCGGKRKLLAFPTDPQVVRKIRLREPFNAP